MTTHVTIDNDGHYTVDVYVVDVSSAHAHTEIRRDTLVATLTPGENTKVTFWSGRELRVVECSPMRTD